MTTEDWLKIAEVIATTCEMLGEKCTTLEQFNALAQPYMSN
jgi:hypothetical protein